MRLDHAGAVKPAHRAARSIEHRTGTAAAGNGFVVLVLRIAKGEVVHGGLAARHHAQGAEQRIGDAGGGLHIARHHRGRRIGVEHGALRDDDLQGFQAPGIERNVIVDQRAEHIQHCSHAHRTWGVEVVDLLRTGACKVDDRAALGHIDLDRHADLCAIVQLQGELPVFELRDHAAHRLFSVVLHMAHVGLHDIQAKLPHHLREFLHALLVGSDLRAQIGQVLLGISAGVWRGAATRRQQAAHLFFQKDATVHQLHVVDLHTLFVDARGERWHRARRGAADVGMVAPAAHIKRGLLALGHIHRGDHRHIGQVGAAMVRVVEHVHIARVHLPRVLADHGLDALTHGTQVNGHVRRIGDQVAGGIEQRTAEVQALLDVD
ncbi:hypothetical protein D3C71_1167470 [compost metagenome]